MFKAPALPPVKKIPARNWHLIYCLKGMKTRILIYLGDVCESKRKTFSENIVFYYEHTVSMSVLVYEQKQMYYKMVVLKNMLKFTRKHLWLVFYNKVAVVWFANLLKKRVWHSCFPVNFEKNFKNTFFIRHLLATASV